ncbi:MAG: L,D-transpeptidase family protein [Candidatus Omnitrophota bacterium]
MKIGKLILLAVAVISLLITAASFAVLEGTKARSEDMWRPDRAKLIYERAEAFLKRGEYNKCRNALAILVERYPTSEYAEKSLRTLAYDSLERGDGMRAHYYYTQILERFPGIKDVNNIYAILGKINMGLLQSPALTENSLIHEVQKGDTLFAIAKKYGTTAGFIKMVNGLKGDLIKPGQKLKIVLSKFSILVDKSRNMLVLKKDGKLFKIYSVSTGENNSTPVGMFKIEEKMIKPTWYKVGTIVSPDSTEYELGERWMGLSIQGYGIHGTRDETTIGAQVTGGCVRMHNSDVVELFDIVPSGTEVEIVDKVA